MSVGSRIKEARESLGLSRSELAKKINVSLSAISNYENDISSPKETALFALIKALKIDANYIYQDMILDNYLKVSLTENHLIQKYRKLDNYSQKAVNSLIDIELQRQDDIIKENIMPYENIKKIPLYPQLVSAGTGQYVVDDIPADTIDVDGNIYRTATYAITVSGDSMQPTYYNGDILIVDRQSVPDDNEVGIFIVDGMGYVKRRGKDELISDNKAYPNVKGIDGFCMGKVLGRI